MLNSWKSSASIAGTVTKSFLNGTINPFIQQARTTIIVKRKFPIRLHKKGQAPHKLKKNDYIYEVVENTNLRKVVPLDIILTQYVEGFGEKGEKISLKPQKAYNEFLLPGLAVYASPENIAKYLTSKTIEEKTYSSLYVPATLKLLRQCCLPVNMSIENPWVIDKWHIRVNFRRIGIYVTDESITMPGKEISGPNLDYEGKEFYITININKTESEKVIVRCRLHHDTFDISKQLPFVTEHWKISGDAIFPEDQEILDSLPRPRWEENSVKK